MIKVFISQPMRGKTEEEILSERKRLFEIAKDVMKPTGEECEEIKSFIKGADKEEPLKALARSIEMLSEADVVVFPSNWETARGCKIEHECAWLYDKIIIEDSPKEAE